MRNHAEGGNSIIRQNLPADPPFASRGTGTELQRIVAQTAMLRVVGLFPLCQRCTLNPTTPPAKLLLLLKKIPTERKYRFLRHTHPGASQNIGRLSHC